MKDWLQCGDSIKIVGSLSKYLRQLQAVVRQKKLNYINEKITFSLFHLLQQKAKNSGNL